MQRFTFCFFFIIIYMAEYYKFLFTQKKKKCILEKNLTENTHFLFKRIHTSFLFF